MSQSESLPKPVYANDPLDPNTIPQAVKDAIKKRHPEEYKEWLKALRFNSIMNCYCITWAGMFVGIELDGEMHT